MTQDASPTAPPAGAPTPAGPSATPMVDRVAALDWAATPLGPRDAWPQSLRTTVDLCLSSRAPMMVVWGERHVQVYNDALAPLMGAKHPDALGRPYAESFPEIWDDVMAPMLESVREQGTSSYLEDLPVSFHRRVPDEEMFWTFSWSPLRDEQGRIAGALHPAVETTGRVLAERRLRLLRDLATSMARAESLSDACALAVEVLGEHPAEVPLAALYLLEAGPGVPTTARLEAAVGAARPEEVFPTEVDLLDAAWTPWPLAAAHRSGRTQSLDGLALDAAWLAPGRRPPTTGLVLPLGRDEDTAPVALLALALAPGRPLDDAQQDFLQLLATQLASALTTAALHARQRDVALALQRSMLPDASRASGLLEVAARYLPGGEGVEVGGDWYDVVSLGAGRTALVIGDVMGRGVHAAAVMGQLRTAVRAYAQLDLPPDRLLELLDRLVEDLSGAAMGQIATCTYAVVDVGDGTLVQASAGHPPAVLFDAHSVRVSDRRVGPPLGTGGASYETTTTELRGGSGVLLYTDGLIERRDSDIDAGVDRLVTALERAGTRDLERLTDAALEVRDASEQDDVAVLTVRVPHADRPLPLVLQLHDQPQAARAARRAAAAVLRDWGVDDDTADDVLLLTTELVNNALTHAGRVRRLRLRHLDDRVVVEVGDADPRPPRRRGADSGDEGGRGLLIVTALAREWGVRHDGSGKIVWAELSLRPPAPVG